MPVTRQCRTNLHLDTGEVIRKNAVKVVCVHKSVVSCEPKYLASALRALHPTVQNIPVKGSKFSDFQCVIVANLIQLQRTFDALALRNISKKHSQTAMKRTMGPPFEPRGVVV